MQVEQLLDLRICSFQKGEALPERLLADPGCDLLRVYEPTDEQRNLLEPLGFVYKPEALFWLKPVEDSSEEYFLSLGYKTRQHVRQAVKAVEANCQVRVEWQLEERTMENWLALYRRHIATLARGIDIAGHDYSTLLAEPERFLGIFLSYDGKLVAGGIVEKAPALSALRLRYFASEAVLRPLGLGRYVYYRLSVLARETGYHFVSAGIDPNFYGHVVSTGLYLFKVRMGFQAEPTKKYALPGRNLLEKVISLEKCEPLILTLGYAEADMLPEKLVGHAYSRQAGLDATPFHASFLQHLYLHHLPETVPSLCE